MRIFLLILFSIATTACSHFSDQNKPSADSFHGLHRSTTSENTCDEIIGHFLPHTQDLIKKVHDSMISDRFTSQLMEQLAPADKRSIESIFKLPLKKIKNILENSDPIPYLTKDYEFYKDTKAPGDVLLLMTLTNPSDHTSGFIIYRFRSSDEDSGTKSTYLELIKLEQGNPLVVGISDKIRNVILDLAKKAKFTRDELEADWIGRYVWAKKGYLFNENTTYYTFNGAPINQLDLTRKNFQNFLFEHGIKIKELVIIGNNGPININNITDLKSPSDFALLTHKNGTKIRVKPYIDDGIFGEEQEMDIGKAFMLTPYQERPGQKATIIDYYDHEHYSDVAMPVWHGYLVL